MTPEESPQQVAERIVREVRAVASQLSYVERVALLRDAASEIGKALEEDPTSHLLNAPQGREWELEGLESVADAASAAYSRAFTEQQSQ
jgi:hypothetical protein